LGWLKVIIENAFPIRVLPWNEHARSLQKELDLLKGLKMAALAGADLASQGGCD